MRIIYFAETDSLYIDLSDRPSVETEEVAEGVMVDYDAGRQVTGIEIHDARTRLDLSRLVLTDFPGDTLRESA